MSRITIESIIRGSCLESERIEFIARQIAGLERFIYELAILVDNVAPALLLKFLSGVKI